MPSFESTLVFRELQHIPEISSLNNNYYRIVSMGGTYSTGDVDMYESCALYQEIEDDFTECFYTLGTLDGTDFVPILRWTGHIRDLTRN